MIKKYLSIFSIIVLLSGSCATLQQLIQKPAVTFRGMKLDTFSFSETTLLFDFNVDNPNPLGLRVDRIGYQLDINGRSFIQGENDQSISIPSQGRGVVHLPLQVEFFEFFQSIQEFMQSDFLDYDLKGSISVGPFQVPFQNSGQFPVPKLPEVSLLDIEIDELTFTSATINFALGLKNINEFAILPKGLTYEISLGDLPFANGKVNKFENIDSQRELKINLPLKLDLISLGHSAFQLLQGASTQYDFSGTLELNIPKFGIRSFPFNQTGQMNIKM